MKNKFRYQKYQLCLVIFDGLRDNAIKNSENGQHRSAQSRPKRKNKNTCTYVKNEGENITVLFGHYIQWIDLINHFHRHEDGFVHSVRLVGQAFASEIG